MRKLIVGLGVVCFLFIGGQTAQAKVVPGKSIAGVAIGATKGQVKVRLGKPSSIQTNCKGVCLCQGNCTSWSYDKGLMGRVVFNSRGRVVAVTTSSPRQRARGVGTGSPIRAFERAFPGSKCGAGIAGPPSRLCVFRTGRGKNLVRTYFSSFDIGRGFNEIAVARGPYRGSSFN